MPTLPRLRNGHINESPHVVILGAGASKAAFPNGDADSRQLPLMQDIVQTIGLESVIESYGLTPKIKDFEAFYDSIATNEKYHALVEQLEYEIRAYFEKLRIPGTVTLYDFLLLSLREKDIIASFNWDPLLVQAYSRNSNIKSLPRICFLHGNVAVGCCLEHQRVGYLYEPCNICNEPMKKVQLMFPVRKKDYAAPYLNSEWSVLRKHLKDAYFVTIFGYCAPPTDIEARSLMLDVWKQNQTVDLAQFEIVDIKSRAELESSWKDFVVHNNFGTTDNFFDTYLAHNPRRSCDAFAMATLQQMPWQNNPLPQHLNRLNRLEDLHKWFKPLLKEEDEQYFSGKPCPPV